MKEYNKKTLRDALNRLPEHAPPAGLWGRVERALTPPLGQRLTSYQPPASVWNGLAEQLAEQPTPKSQPAPILPWARQLPLRWLTVAAALLLTVGIGYTALAAETGPKVTYAHSKEVAPSSSLSNDWDEDEESFRAVLAQLETINEPELNTMRMELEELTAAKQDVKAMLVAYGEDPAVVRQLVAIERDRSDVYRRIIVRL